MKYQEINELYDFCVKHKIKARFESLYDGYAIRFPNGSDIVQHRYSYGSAKGFLEPAIGCAIDYTPVSLILAKLLVIERFGKISKKTPKVRRYTAEQVSNMSSRELEKHKDFITTFLEKW